ncbi:tRNA lysidine(34) synthetase TilS [Neisseria musculi]|uniref:tRNA(Ile)-lysidine synthase n=1 Tax=Neisseria musculi TaxID=1815583 RepID=A0A7H1MFI2_9NEIS|nr:tRNA lysidine(34) synthetase TilS [Neisseria musculi]QNT60397.1 tRNA(Ile)-lysidine synthetase, C-terminal domain [Neisseria musculi]
MNTALHPLQQRLAAAWPHDFPAGTRIEAGLSGGLDSVVLLHLLAALQPRFGFALSAVHVHHGLNACADEWADFCRNLCREWGIALRLEKVTVADNSRLGIEAEARRQRYRVFSDGRCDVLALAHHQNDQVETFMLAALRGGGLRALSAMPQRRPLGGRIELWRPLLEESRETLESYAAEQGLAYVEDGSNGDSAFLRNWLRHEALPQWRNRVPHLDRHIVRSIGSLQNELTLLNEIVEQDYAYICAAGAFSIARWKTLSGARRRQQLLHFAKLHGLGVPAAESTADFSRVLGTMKTVSAEWPLPHGKIHAYRDTLFAQKTGWQDTLPWVAGGAVLTGRLKNILPENGFTLKPHSFGMCEKLLNEECVIRAANAEDVIQTTIGRKNVWKVLQESKVPPFARRYWPVVADSGNRCAAIANIRVSVHHSSPNGAIPVFDKFNCFILEPK